MSGDSGSQASSSITLSQGEKILHDEVVGDDDDGDNEEACPVGDDDDGDNEDGGDYPSRRVKAYLGFGGTQVCLAGVGERANFGTFPRSWTAGDMMDTSGWIEILKCPEENERPKVGEHYNLIEPPCWRPKGVVFHMTFPQKSLICVRNDEIGWLTDYITLMNTKGTIAFEEPEDPSDNDSVKTPDTPDGYVSPPYW